MAFISNFWAAYVPVAIVVVAAVIELAVDRRKGRTPHPSPDKRENTPGTAVVFYMAWPPAPRGTTVPAGAISGRVISLQEARRRRSHAPSESGTWRNRA